MTVKLQLCCLPLLFVLAACDGTRLGTEGCRPPPPRTLHRGATDVTFLAFGDPQIDYRDPAPARKQVTAFNAVEGRARWRHDGRRLTRIRGVVIAGDLTENALDREYRLFTSLYGLCGNRLLRYPVYEGYGNHDFAGKGSEPVVDSVSLRNRFRRGLVASAPGRDGHYSWEWDNVHFIQLNLVPADSLPPGRRGLDPRRALAFLRRDLEEHVRGTRKRVVIVSHYGFTRWEQRGWWARTGHDAFFRVLDGYRVIAILHGHNHGTAVYRWRGIPVVNLGSPFYKRFNRDRRGHFTALRITDTSMLVQDFAWDPARPADTAVWTSSFAAVIPLRRPGPPANHD